MKIKKVKRKRKKEDEVEIKGIKKDLRTFGKRRVKVPGIPKAWKKRMVVKFEKTNRRVE